MAKFDALCSRSCQRLPRRTFLRLSPAFCPSTEGISGPKRSVRITILPTFNTTLGSAFEVALNLLPRSGCRSGITFKGNATLDCPSLCKVFRTLRAKARPARLKIDLHVYYYTYRQAIWRLPPTLPKGGVGRHKNANIYIITNHNTQIRQTNQNTHTRKHKITKHDTQITKTKNKTSKLIQITKTT